MHVLVQVMPYPLLTTLSACAGLVCYGLICIGLQYSNGCALCSRPGAADAQSLSSLC